MIKAELLGVCMPIACTQTYSVAGICAGPLKQMIKTHSIGSHQSRFDVCRLAIMCLGSCWHWKSGVVQTKVVLAWDSHSKNWGFDRCDFQIRPELGC